MPTAGYGECTSPIGCTRKTSCRPSSSYSCRSRNPSPKRSLNKPVSPANSRDHVRRDDKTFFFKRNSFTPKFTPFYTKNNITIVVIVHPQKILYFCALCLPLNYFRVPKTKAIQGHIGVDSKVSLSPRKTKNRRKQSKRKTKTKPVNSSAATPKKQEQERGSGN